MIKGGYPTGTNSQQQNESTSPSNHQPYKSNSYLPNHQPLALSSAEVEHKKAVNSPIDSPGAVLFSEAGSQSPIVAQEQEPYFQAEAINMQPKPLLSSSNDKSQSSMGEDDSSNSASMPAIAPTTTQQKKHKQQKNDLNQQNSDSQQLYRQYSDKYLQAKRDSTALGLARHNTTWKKQGRVGPVLLNQPQRWKETTPIISPSPSSSSREEDKSQVSSHDQTTRCQRGSSVDKQTKHQTPKTNSYRTVVPKTSVKPYKSKRSFLIQIPLVSDRGNVGLFNSNSKKNLAMPSKDLQSFESKREAFLTAFQKSNNKSQPKRLRSNSPKPESDPHINKPNRDNNKNTADIMLSNNEPSLNQHSGKPLKTNSTKEKKQNFYKVESTFQKQLPSSLQDTYRHTQKYFTPSKPKIPTKKKTNAYSVSDGQCISHNANQTTKTTPRSLLKNFNRSRQGVSNLENYESMSFGGNSRASKQPSESVVGSHSDQFNNSKKANSFIEENKSNWDLPCYKIVEEISVEDIQYNFQQPSHQEVPTCKSATTVARKRSPKQRSKTGGMLNIQKSNGNAQSELNSPNKIKMSKTSSQSDLKKHDRITGQKGNQKRAQDVRELSVKRSKLAQDRQEYQKKNFIAYFNKPEKFGGPQWGVSPKRIQSKGKGSIDLRFAQIQKQSTLVNNLQAQLNVQPESLANTPRNTMISKDYFQPNQELATSAKGSLSNQKVQAKRRLPERQNFEIPQKEILKEDSKEESDIISQDEPAIQSFSLMNRFRNLFKKDEAQVDLNPNIDIPDERTDSFHLAKDNTIDVSQKVNQEDELELLNDDKNKVCPKKETSTIEEEEHCNQPQIDSVSGSQSQFFCSCKRDEGITYACSRAIEWFKVLNKTQELDIKRMKELYKNLLECSELSEYENQIMKDLTRTFPKCPQFQGRIGQQALKRVLLAFSRYDPTIGYVQGMNFIVGSILYHCDEEPAFWMFVALIEAFEMRDIYEPGLPGLYKHCFVMDRLIQANIPDLHNHFNEFSILVEMYASDWVFCLFSNILPIDLMADFYDNFFAQGWPFFYRFSLSMLGIFKDKLLEEDEFSGILTHIKFKTPEKDASQGTSSESEQLGSSENQVFVFNESTNTFSKKEPLDQKPQEQSRLQKMFWFLAKKQDDIWQRIFLMCNQWQVSDDIIKQILQQFELKVCLSSSDNEEYSPVKIRSSAKEK